MLSTSSAIDAANWSILEHIGQDAASEDGAIWLCMGIQLTLAGYDIPNWCSEYIMPCRKYIANCLLDGKCPEAKDLLISRLESDMLQNDNIVMSSSAVRETRLCTNKYALLDEDYSYIPQVDCSNHSHNTRQVDISPRQISAIERQSISLWLLNTSASHVLHENQFRGEVTTGDIQDLVHPSTLTVGLILHLLFTQYPVGHSSVLILDQSLMEVIRDQDWVSVMQSPSHPAHPSLMDFFQSFMTKEWIVVLYCDNTHFTSHVVRYTCQYTGVEHNITGQITYLDSFLDHGTVRSEIFQTFLTWAGTHARPQISHFNWSIVQIRQVP